MEKALFWAGQTERRLGRTEDARTLFDPLRPDHPQSRIHRKVPRLPETPVAATAATGL